VTTRLSIACFVAVLCCCLVSCAKPPIETGPQSTVAARKSLEGNWDLLSLEVAASDGRRAAVPASGGMILDGFGNLGIEYRISDAGLQALTKIGVNNPNPVINTTGKVVIDTAKHQVRYLHEDDPARAFDADLAARRENPFALEHVRIYSIDQNGVLTLSTRYENGKDAGTSTWRKQKPPPEP
jgi:hypothetical protein